MALVTAQDYIYQALRRCGQLRPGYTSNTELLSDGLDAWVIMFDSLNAKRTNAYSIPDYVYPIGSITGLDGIYGQNVQFTIGPSFTFSATLTSGSATATVTNTAGLILGQAITGSGIPANTTIQGITINTNITLSQNATSNGASTITVPPSFVGPRPEAILRMNLVMTSSNPGQPTRIPLAPIGAEQWANIAVVQLTAIDVTTVFYYDPQFPQGVINVWPPLNGNSLEFFTWGSLTPPTGLTSTYSAPPGYAEVIIWELAKELWPMATRDVWINKLPFQYICGRAKAAKDAIRAVNAPMPKLRNDFGGGRGPGANVNSWSLLLEGIPY